jgi:hypothetical protein
MMKFYADVDVRYAIDNQGIATKSYKADFVVIAFRVGVSLPSAQRIR